MSAQVLPGMVPCMADGGGDFACGIELVRKSRERLADFYAVRARRAR